MANEEANRPNPELCLSPIYRNMYVPGPDISEVRVRVRVRDRVSPPSPSP